MLVFIHNHANRKNLNQILFFKCKRPKCSTILSINVLIYLWRESGFNPSYFAICISIRFWFIFPLKVPPRNPKLWGRVWGFRSWFLRGDWRNGHLNQYHFLKLLAIKIWEWIMTTRLIYSLLSCHCNNKQSQRCGTFAHALHLHREKKL